MKLSVIIPVYNEEKTVGEILQKVKDVDLPNIEKEIIVVDDCSTDNTVEIIKNDPDIKVVCHSSNQGKGAAIRTGLKSFSGDLLIIQDADLEYNPQEYEHLLTPIIEDKAPVVYGSRFKGKSENMSTAHRLGNQFLTLVTSILYGTRLTDMETCYKLFTKEALEGINIKANRFDFEPEVTAKLLKKGLKITEVPISYTARDFDEGKKISWRDGTTALWTLVKYRFAN